MAKRSRDSPKWHSFQKLKFSSRSFVERRKKIENATTRHAQKFIVKRLHKLGDVSRAIVGWISLVSLLIVLAIGQPIWSASSMFEQAGVEGGTYAEGMRGPLQNINALYASSSAEVAVSKLIFSSLYKYDQTGHLKGDLATDISVDDSGKIYTLKIAPNLHWSDGEALTAKDIVFTVNLLKNPVVRANTFSTWRDVTAKQIDDTTLTLKLPNIYASFQTTLTFGVLPEHILGSIAPEQIRENSFSKEPIGSGPYKFKFSQIVDATEGRSIATLEKNEEYYNTKSKISLMKIYAFNDENQIVEALKKNEINAATGITAESIAQIDQQKYTVDRYAVHSGVYGFFNTTNGPLKDKKIRQALQVGINTRAIRAALPGEPKALSLPLLASQTDATQPDIPEYDAQKAAEILESAGWKFKEGDKEKAQRYKDGEPLQITIATAKSVNYQKTLEMITSDARKLGIKVNAQVEDQDNPSQNITQSVIRPRAYDMLIYEIALGSDPDVLAYWDSSQASERGLNLSNYNSPIVDDSLQGARSTLDAKLRSAKYTTFMKQWVADAPAIGLYQAQMLYVYAKSIQSLDASHTLVSPGARFGDATHWTVEQKSVYKTP